MLITLRGATPARTYVNRRMAAGSPVRQIELYHNTEGIVFCLLDGPDEEAIRRHHAALGVSCGDVHRVDGLT